MTQLIVNHYLQVIYMISLVVMETLDNSNSSFCRGNPLIDSFYNNLYNFCSLNVNVNNVIIN